jgi:hypothetical protein
MADYWSDLMAERFKPVWYKKWGCYHVVINMSWGNEHPFGMVYSVAFACGDCVGLQVEPELITTTINQNRMDRMRMCVQCRRFVQRQQRAIASAWRRCARKEVVT